MKENRDGVEDLTAFSSVYDGLLILCKNLIASSSYGLLSYLYLNSCYEK
ncbi:MAG: hypothetical protein GX050_08415 [Firmicutes bacterium]|nr:hypothetical protein [Bacillota bacterium]